MGTHFVVGAVVVGAGFVGVGFVGIGAMGVVVGVGLGAGFRGAVGRGAVGLGAGFRGAVGSGGCVGRGAISFVVLRAEPLTKAIEVPA